MIYSRQKGELMVSENRSSEAESHAFIGKWCISIHNSFKYIKGAQSSARKPRNVGGKGMQCACCEWHGELPAMFTADGTLSPSVFVIIKQAILEDSDTFAFAKHESASQYQLFFLSSVIKGERFSKSKQKG